MRAAVTQTEINLLSSQIVKRLDVSADQYVKLLIVELGDVLQVFLDAWERRLDGVIRYVPYVALAVSTVLAWATAAVFAGPPLPIVGTAS